MRITSLNYHEEATLFMNSRPPGPDKTKGFMIQPGTQEARWWLAYFETKGMKASRSLAGERLAASKPYMVPSQSPREFDPEYVYQPSAPREARGANRLSTEMTFEEREAAVARAMRWAQSPDDQKTPDEIDRMMETAA